MRGSDYLFVGLAWRAQLLLEGDTASADQSDVADFFGKKIRVSRQVLCVCAPIPPRDWALQRIGTNSAVTLPAASASKGGISKLDLS
jgi:hypothetical protein